MFFLIFFDFWPGDLGGPCGGGLGDLKTTNNENKRHQTTHCFCCFFFYFGPADRGGPSGRGLGDLKTKRIKNNPKTHTVLLLFILGLWTWRTTFRTTSRITFRISSMTKPSNKSLLKPLSEPNPKSLHFLNQTSKKHQQHKYFLDPAKLGARMPLMYIYLNRASMGSLQEFHTFWIPLLAARGRLGGGCYGIVYKGEYIDAFDEEIQLPITLKIIDLSRSESNATKEPTPKSLPITLGPNTPRP